MNNTVTTLTPLERILLLNQYRILERLGDTDGCNTLPQIILALHEGYISHALNLIQKYIDDPVPDSIQEEVRSILGMFRVVDPLRSGEAATPLFLGFSKDTEEEHYHYTQFLSWAGEEWNESLVPGRDYASDHSVLNEYRAMLRVYRDTALPLHGELDLEDRIRILTEAPTEVKRIAMQRGLLPSA